MRRLLLASVLLACSSPAFAVEADAHQTGEPMHIERIHYPEHKVAGKPLGRHVVHDPRSRAFEAPRAAVLKTVEHARRVPIFDQGNLGSCTGNAAVGCISSDPFAFRGTEKDAVAVYSEATHLDSVPGVYPPSDTGSSGLAVMKALKKRGLITGYTHAFSKAGALGALVLGPGIVGMAWLTGCDNPDETGLVHYTGSLRGGHEVELVGLDVERQRVKLANSWGPGWGRSGFFYLTFNDFGKALADRGDATFPALPG